MKIYLVRHGQQVVDQLRTIDFRQRNARKKDHIEESVVQEVSQKIKLLLP